MKAIWNQGKNFIEMLSKRMKNCGAVQKFYHIFMERWELNSCLRKTSFKKFPNRRFSTEHPQSTTTLLFSFRHNKNFQSNSSFESLHQKTFSFHFLHIWNDKNEDSLISNVFYDSKEKKKEIFYLIFMFAFQWLTKENLVVIFVRFYYLSGDLFSLDLIRKRPGLPLDYHEIYSHELFLVHFDKSIYCSKPLTSFA